MLCPYQEIRMKRPLEIKESTQIRNMQPVPSLATVASPPTLFSLPSELRHGVLGKVLMHLYSETGSDSFAVRFLRMTSVCKAWRTGLIDHIHAADSAFVLNRLLDQAWATSLTPLQWRDRALQSFSYLTLKPSIAPLRAWPTPPAVIVAESVGLNHLYNLGLPLDWGGRLRGSLLVNTGAEMNLFLEWLQGRDCILDLELETSSAEHALSSHDLNRWGSLLAEPQKWRGEIRVGLAQWAVWLAQAAQHTGWQLSWQDGAFTLRHGEAETAAVHDMAWTRETSYSISERVREDNSRPAQLTRCISFMDLQDFATERSTLQLGYVRWNQHESVAGLAPGMLTRPGLTDLHLIFKREDQDVFYAESDEEAGASATPTPCAASAVFLKAASAAGTLQRLLIQVGDDWEYDAQAQSGDLLNLVLRGNPGLQAVSLLEMSRTMMANRGFYEVLAGLYKLRQLAFVGPHCLPPVACMRSLLNALPGLAELRILCGDELSSEQPAWLEQLALTLANHPGLKLIEFNSEAIFQLQSTVQKHQIRRWNDLALRDGARTLVIKARPGQ
jgi:hypothetical protein